MFKKSVINRRINVSAHYWKKEKHLMVCKVFPRVSGSSNLSKESGNDYIPLLQNLSHVHKVGELVDGVLTPRILYKFREGRAEFIYVWGASPASPAIQSSGEAIYFM